MEAEHQKSLLRIRGSLTSSMFQHNSVKSNVSVSFMPGLDKMSLVVISMEGVKAFEKSAMDLQLLHNQIHILVFGGYW